MRSRLCIVIAALAAGLSLNASAQTTAAAGTVIMLPLVADIPAAYTTTVFVQNTHGTSITVNVTYNFSNDADPAIAGTQLACTPLVVAGNAIATFDPYTQCSLSTAIPSGTTNIFGTLLLVDATATVKANTFYAYSRTAQPPGGPGPYNGFSVEGFPVGNFSSATASAIGLQGTTAAPHFRSNCFIGALNEQVDWQLRLYDATGTPVIAPNNPLSGTLLPYQTTRILNVYAAVNGAPFTTTYDYSNVRATFSNIDSSAMIAFCTVETTDNGSADFRIAKSDDARDVRQSRQACYGMDSCGLTSSGTNPARLASSSTKNIHYTILDQPDFVQCSLVSDTTQHLGDLEIMLRVPGDPQTALQFNVSAQPSPYNNTSIYSSGGPAATTFYIYSGEKSTIASGATTRWYIDVSGNKSSPNLAADLAATASAGGIPYGINCVAGNGMTVPWLGTTGPANP